MQSKNHGEDNWTCFICKVFTSIHNIGIRNHILKSHCAEATEEQKLRHKPARRRKTICAISDLKVKDLKNSSKVQRHEFDINWIREMVESSVEKSETGDSSWKCCICKNFSTFHAAGIRRHIYQVHSKKEPKNIKERRMSMMRVKHQEERRRSVINLKHDRNKEWIKEMIDKSKQADKEIWTCCLCTSDPLISSTHLGMRAHITFIHTVKRKQETRKRKRIEVSEKHEYCKEWIVDRIKESKVDETNEWTCCLCKEFTSKHFNGIKAHIIFIHCNKKSENEKPVDESLRHERDPIWVDQMVENSKLEGENETWSCCLCNEFKTKFLGKYFFSSVTVSIFDCLFFSKFQT